AYSEPIRITHDWDISILSEYDNQYAAGGEDALIDGLIGNANFKTGIWQGYYGKDFEAVIDLKEMTSIEQVRTRALQDIKPWIWYPSEVIYYASEDGENFTLVETVKNTSPTDSYAITVMPFSSTKPFMARYLKLVAKSFGTIPDWHLGRGNPSWLFLDEIQIDVTQ
ncbi:MAG: discoidin domain-containing protein, partial [Flavobacteriales bacterium]|nr:discoidin domain-containing protein [Flavobacteriales bacterium]